MTIMDKINAMTVAAGGNPSGGSIVDCLANLAKVKGVEIDGNAADNLPGNLSIAEAMAAVLTPAEQEEVLGEG